MVEDIDSSYQIFRNRENFYNEILPSTKELFHSGLEALDLGYIRDSIPFEKINIRYLSATQIEKYALKETGLYKAGVAGVNSIILPPLELVYSDYGFRYPHLLYDREIAIKDNSPQPLFDLLHEFWHLMTDGFLYRAKIELSNFNEHEDQHKFNKIYYRIKSINEGFTEFMSQINRGLVLEEPKLSQNDKNAYSSNVKFITYLIIELHKQIRQFRHNRPIDLHKSLVEYTCFGAKMTYFNTALKNYLGIDLLDLSDDNQRRVVDLYNSSQESDVRSLDWVKILRQG